MSTQTVLTMTQNILSALSSDEVNSISDTTESMQVAQILQNKYYDIVSRGDLPKHDEVFQLNPSGDSLKPVLMTVPTGIAKIKWLKYFDSNTNNIVTTGSFSHGVNQDIVSSVFWVTTSSSTNTLGLGNKVFTVASSTLPITVGQGVLCTAGTASMFGNVVSYAGTTLTISVLSFVSSGTFSSWVIQTAQTNAIPGYQYVTILPIQQFLDLVNNFNPSQSNVGSFVFTEAGENFTFYYKNNLQPKYCTVISNFYVIFDQYDNTQDSTLQASKTMVFGQLVPTFTLSDNFVPSLDDQQFPLLLNEAKALAFYELRQTPHAKAEQEIKRQWSATQRNKSMSGKPTAFNSLADFGRVPRSGGYSGYPIYRWMREST